MGGILDKLDEWLRGLLIEGITGNLSGMFDTVNTKVGEIAGEVGQTPLAWNSGVFSMIRNLSETVIVPIAGVIPLSAETADQAELCKGTATSRENRKEHSGLGEKCGTESKGRIQGNLSLHQAS